MTDQAKIKVGKVEGGYAAWCYTCESGKGAMTGIDRLDENVISVLAAQHEAWHTNGYGTPWL